MTEKPSPVARPQRRLASPDIRDRFLTALDTQDNASLRDIASYLIGCDNLLPSSTCVQLGLEPGSTYGDGVEAVMNGRRPDAATSTT